MRVIYWLVAVPLMVLAVDFAVSNMGSVTLTLWPFPATVAPPIYLLAFVVFAIGFFAGGFVAWLGAGRYRGRARRAERDLTQRTRDVDGLRDKLDHSEARVRQATRDSETPVGGTGDGSGEPGEAKANPTRVAAEPR
jgi:uncharacterized integral membrane protein